MQPREPRKDDAPGAGGVHSTQQQHLESNPTATGNGGATCPPIRFSRGTRTTDAYPAQRVARSFDDFERMVLADRSKSKGKTYITSPLRVNGDGRAHRCKEGVEPRFFLSFDLDGVLDAETFDKLREWLAPRYRGFGYTTSRHTHDAPRARLILATNRAVDRAEGERLCLAIERDIKAALGADVATFDQSVYRGEQPCFTPLVGAQTFHFEGAPVDVDAVLVDAPEVESKTSSADVLKTAAAADPILRCLSEKKMVKRDMGGGRYAVVCPCEKDHSGESGTTATVYYLPHFGGYTVGNISCMHDHCRERPQGEFIEALGLNVSDVRSAQASGPVAKPEEFSVVPKSDATPGRPKYARRKSGAIIASTPNLLRALRCHTEIGCQIGYDSFAAARMLAELPGEWRPFDDTDYTVIEERLEQNGFEPIPHERFSRAVDLVGKEQTFDSAIVWAKSLEWDGTLRIDEFLSRYFNAEDTLYHRAVSAYTWTALADRCLDPGCQADMMPVFVGEQGLIKSGAIEVMVPDPQFFCHLDFSVRDDNLSRMMRGKLIAEIPELKGLRTRDAEAIKAFVTRRVEEWVPKYREFATRYPRRLIFIGTTNEHTFLDDITGNRRWLPVRVGKVDRPAIERDRDQLWAEGIMRWSLAGVEWQAAEQLAPEFIANSRSPTTHGRTRSGSGSNTSRSARTAKPGAMFRS